MKKPYFLPLLLLSVIVPVCSVYAEYVENPEITEEPDFYSVPGVNSGRSYDVTEDLIVDTFSGSMQTHAQDMVLTGIGPDIVVQRSYNSVPSILSEYSYMGPGWDIHFGRIIGRYDCSDNNYSQQTVRLFFVKPNGS